MKTGIPIIRHVAWLSLVPQLALYAVLIGIVRFALPDLDPVLVGGLAYIALLYLGRFGIARHHRRGVRCLKAGRFDKAIPAFEESLAFFAKHPWLDRYRFITLLSSSAASYREMALCNIGFAYSQTGAGEKAREAYEQTLEEFPESGTARAALNMMKAAGALGDGSQKAQ